MAKPVNVIKITRRKTPAKLKTCAILIDKKELQVHLVEALARESDGRETWARRNDVLFDLEMLVRSGQSSGRFPILTCSCAAGAECTGVESDIEVVHQGDTVKWTCGVPELWILGRPKFLSFTFHRPQYLKELAKFDQG